VRDIVVEARRTVFLDFGPITRLQGDARVPIDISQVGTKLWFTVKENITDLYDDAKVAKTYEMTGGGQTGVGFAITTASSLTIPNGTIGIEDDEIDPEGVNGVYWLWDLTLEEPSGRRETVDGGTFKVLLPVSNPPA